MDKTKKITLCVLLVGCLFVFASCGKKKADPNKPVTEVTAEAEKMDAKQLQEMVDSYTEAINAKKADVEKIMAKLKKVPITEMVGEDAKALKADIDSVNKTLAALSERMKIYAGKL
jgi:vancomycin resistance protein YoaR